MDLGIKGRKAVVCASSRGLGLACAASLAGEGVDVVINGRDADRLNAAVSEILHITGRTVTSVAADIDTAEGRGILIESCPDADILVNNNSGPPPRNFLDVTHQDWLDAIGRNTLPALGLIKAFLPGMQARRFGRIINITSAMVKSPSPSMETSTASRAALTAACKAISRTAAPFNVTINNLLPERFETDRQRFMAEKMMKETGITLQEARAQSSRRFPRDGSVSRKSLATCALSCAASSRALLPVKTFSLTAALTKVSSNPDWSPGLGTTDGHIARWEKDAPMTSTSADTRVLIIGAGPVGLLSAILLARQGIASVLVERRTGRSRAPKAHALNPRSLEICRAAGLDLNQIYARQTPPDESKAVRFMSSLSGVELGWLPYERQDVAVLSLTPTPLVNIAQPDFELVLLNAAEQLALIDIRYGHEWIGARQSDDGVFSTMKQNASDEYTELFPYVIACDGAGSTVRASLNVEMEGDAELVNSVNIHFKADLHPATRDRPAILYWILDPAIAGTFIVYNLGSSIVYVWRYDPAKESAESFTAERCRELVSAAMGDNSIDFEILGARTWVMTAQVASHYRNGRIFLAGDAAHRFPPTGGLGLNTGIGDAQNLAWKIGMVWKGHASDGLLDTYESERRPIAVVNSNQSFVNADRLAELFALVEGPDARNATFLERLADPAFREALHRGIERQRQHFDSLGLQLGYIYGEPENVPEDVSIYTPVFRRGARMPHAWVEQSEKTISTLDLLSDDAFTLIVCATDQAWSDAAARLQIAVRVIRQGSDFTDPEGSWSEQSGLATGGALFLRPDGHIALQANDNVGALGALSEAAECFTGRMK